MSTLTTVPTRFSNKTFLRCGIFSSLLYVAMNIFVPMFYAGYSSVTQTVSELSAIGTPTRMLWVILSVGYTLLVTAFGWGVWQSAGSNRYLRMAGILLFTYGITSILWPFAPMHQRAALAASEASLSDTMHLTLAAVTVVVMVLAMGFGAAALGRRFRIYSIMTILILLVFGILTGMDAPKVEANLPTPWAGVWERINIGVFLLWIVVLARILLRKEKMSERPNRVSFRA